MGVTNRDNALLMATGIDNSGLKKDLQDMEKEMDAFSRRMQSKEVKGILNNILGDFNQNIQGLARIQKELSEITAQRASINKAEKAGMITTKESIQQRAQLLAREVELKNAKKELAAALNTEMRAMQAADGSIEKAALSLAQLTAAYDKLNAKERNGAAGAALASQISQAEAELLRLNAAMRATVIETDKLNQSAANTTSKRGGFNSLGYSVQQVARELPSLTMGASTFFLAISNNLPILGDELHKAKVEYEALKASGQKGVPVWKQVASSIMNWQTAMILGVTILSMHGKEIVAWTKSLLKGKEAMKSTIEMQEEINNSIEKSASGFGDAVTKIRGLQDEWVALGDSMQKKKQFIEENQSVFNELGVAVTGVKDAENILISNTDAFIQALKLRAQASAAQKLASEAYEKQLQAERKAELEAIKGPSNWQKIKAGMISGMMSGERANVLEDNSPTAEDFHRDRLKSLKEEADQAKATGDAYFDLQRKREQDIDSILKQAGISTKGKKIDTKILDLQKRINEELLRLQQDNERARLDLMNESMEKRLALINHEYDQEINALDNKMKEWREAQGGQLTPKQTAAYDQAYQQVFEKRLKAEENVYKESEKLQAKKNEKERQSWIDYNKTYGDYQAKKLAITEDYTNRIAKAETSGEKASLEKQKEYAIKELDKSILEESQLWTRLFDDASKQTSQYVQDTINELQQLVDFINGVDGSFLPKKWENVDVKSLFKDAKDVEAIMNRLKVLRDELNKRNPFNQLIKGFNDLKDAGDDTNKQFAATQDIIDGLSGISSIIGDIGSALSDADSSAGDFLNKMSDLIGQTASLATTGMSLGGPIGAVVGGVIGLGSGVLSLLGGTKELSEETIRSYNVYMDTLDELIGKQKELLLTTSGTTATEISRQTADTIQKQIDAIQQMGVDWLNSGTGTFSHSHGYKLAKTLKPFKDELASIGIDFDSLGGRMEGLFSLDSSVINSLKWDLPLVWSKLDDSTREYLESILAADEAMKDLENTTTQAITGMSFDSLKDNLDDLVSSYDLAFDDISKSFEDHMGKAMLNMLKTEYLNKELKEWHNMLEERAADGEISDNDRIELEKYYEDIIRKNNERYKQSMSAAGFDVSAKEDDSASGNSLKGAYSKASQESIDLLAGQTGAARVVLEDIRRMMSESGSIEQTQYLRSFQDSLAVIRDLQMNGWKEVSIIRDMSQRISESNNTITQNTQRLNDISERIAESTERTANKLNDRIDVKIKGGSGLWS